MRAFCAIPDLAPLPHLDQRGQLDLLVADPLRSFPSSADSGFAMRGGSGSTTGKPLASMYSAPCAAPAQAAFEGREARTR